MTSDERRREVAAKLRDNLGYMRDNEKWYECDLDSEKCGNMAYRCIAASVEESGNFVNGNYIHIVETLADLIDRTCEMTECSIDHGSRSWGMRCSRCGTEFEHERPAYGWRYCPNCGARVVRAND